MEEQQAMSWLRRYTDGVCTILRYVDLNESDAVELLHEARNAVLQQFPGTENQYAIIYERRYRRILARRGIYLPLNGEDTQRN